MSRASEYARNVSDLYARQGEIRGQAAANSGAIWGRTIATLGDVAGQAFQQFGEQQKEKKLRDLFQRAADEYEQGQSGIVSRESGIRIGEAIEREKAAGTYRGPADREFVGHEDPRQPRRDPVSGITSPAIIPEAVAADPRIHRLLTGQVPQPTKRRTSPFPTPSELIRELGPEAGIKVANGIAALHPAQEQEDPEKILKRLQSIAKGLDALPEAIRAEYYPEIVKLAESQGWLRPGTLNPVYVPEEWQFIMGTGNEPTKTGTRAIETTQGGVTGTAIVEDVPGGFYPSPDKAETKGPGLWVLRDGKTVRVRENDVLPTDQRPVSEGESAAGSFGEYIRKKYGDNPTAEQIIAGRRAYFPPQPPVPVVIQTDQGPGLLNRGRGTVSPITVEGTGEQVKPAPTADMRNKAAARGLVGKSIAAIEDLSKRIITKIGPAQRAQAIRRGAEAVFGSDPEFRTYQDARMALAGNLAVAQQGSRPSDADIKAIWLPLVPDAYRDTAESAQMKWDLIKTMSNTPPSEGTPDAGIVEEWERGPDGKLRRKAK